MTVTVILLIIFVFAQLLSLLMLFRRPWKTMSRRQAIGNVIATVGLWLILDAIVVWYLLENGLA